MRDLDFLYSKVPAASTAKFSYLRYLRMLRVLATGPSCTVQDRGRTGYARYGISQSGAIDLKAAEMANQLAGNAPDAAVIEVAMGGSAFEILDRCRLALCGAGGSNLMESWSSRELEPGDILKIHGSPTAVWTYLAIASGIAADTHLGSRSYHSRSGLGTALERGSIIKTSSDRKFTFDSVATRRLLSTERTDYSSTAPFPLLPGPDYDSFPPDLIEKITSENWDISPRSDRTGQRFISSCPLAHDISLPSTPTVLGALQIPPSGEMIMTLNDGPTLGGYPVPVVLPEVERVRLAQCTPGRQVTFTWSHQ